jgi:hypothetical protein
MHARARTAGRFLILGLVLIGSGRIGGEAGGPVERDGTPAAAIDGRPAATLGRSGSFEIPGTGGRAAPCEGAAPAGLVPGGGIAADPARRRVSASMFPVPEPASWVVALSFSVGLVLRRRLQARL